MLLLLVVIEPVLLLYRKHAQKFWWVFRELRPAVLGESFLLLVATGGLAFGLYSLFPALDISWLYLFTGRATNLALLPVSLGATGGGWLIVPGLVYLVLFALVVPVNAATEERRFRHKTVGMAQAMGRSLWFGLSHCRMGIPLYAALALTLPGLWWSWRYVKGGLDVATLHHATYNLWVVALATVALIVLLFR